MFELLKTPAWHRCANNLSGIGEQDTDTVFTRSFAVLITAALVGVDSKRRILPEQLVRQAANSVINYARREWDHRGYVDHKGWAHSLAHTADALDSCAQHPTITMKERITILETIAEMVMLPEPLTYLEDDRLAFPVYRIIHAKQVSQEFLQSWMSRFEIDDIHSNQAALRHVNAQHFLRSLYFLLQWEQPNHPLIEVIVNRLKRLNIYYRYGPLGSSAEN